MRLLLFKLAGQFVHAGLVLREDGVDRQVNVAVGLDAAQLLCDVVDYGLTSIVLVWLAQVPGL